MYIICTECGLIIESYVESNQKNLRGHFRCSSSNEVLYFNKQKTNHRLDIQQLGAVFELHGWLTGQNNEINKFPKFNFSIEELRFLELVFPTIVIPHFLKVHQVVCIKDRLKKCIIPPEATRPRLERVSFTEIIILNSCIATLYYFIWWLCLSPAIKLHDDF